ncbi:Alpha-ketoglutarate-dependent dioxygenase alkB 2 [Datura stramonium]|uniref:Alpha-ketoglutarate-dependent dioxygenase alkB 2 n=1 Tax=Datura stramonium TaxID=4076 RepID=A0ABS8RNN1_DATST|nr:Alpha-ketoglutarate-dependent dioxygenase alkB 2 [Datura stramonium]
MLHSKKVPTENVDKGKVLKAPSNFRISFYANGDGDEAILKAETGGRRGRETENEAEQSEAAAATSDSRTKRVVELGNGSQPRDSCYVASEGLPQLVYSGYQPHAYSWDEFPPLKDILDAVHKALPGSRFNSLLLNRYKGGNDYVGWHADDEKLYGPTPEIASLSIGCEREFLLKKKPDKTPRGKNTSGEQPKKRLKMDGSPDKHSFVLKHGSLLVMRGYTQRDWLHSVPKRVKADSLRINLTFRLVL